MGLFKKNIDFSNTAAEQFLIESQNNIHNISLEEKRDLMRKTIDKMFLEEKESEIFYFIRYCFGYQLDKNTISSLTMLWDINDDKIIKTAEIDSDIIFTIIDNENWSENINKKIRYPYEYYVELSTKFLPKLPLYHNLISEVENNIEEFFSSLDYKLINIKTQYIEDHSGNATSSFSNEGKPYSFVFADFLIKLKK